MTKLAIPITLLLTFASCDFGDSSEANIQLGRSIESVELNFTADNVKAVLGEPAHIDKGDYAGFEYFYNPGSSRQYALKILFAEENKSRVIAIRVLGGYAGVTKDGLRIGSHKSDVVKHIGNADATQLTHNWRSLGNRQVMGDVYKHSNQTASIISYNENERVEEISMMLVSF